MLKQMLCLGTIMLSLIATPVVAQVQPFGDFQERPAACTKDDVRKVMGAVVSIQRTLPLEEEYTDEKGVRVTSLAATAWRMGVHTIATVAHVVTGMRLTTEWKGITIAISDAEYAKPHTILETEVRVAHVGAQEGNDAVVILELKEMLPETVLRAAQRPTPLVNDEAVMAVGYSHQRLRLATGTLAFPKESGEGAPSDTRMMQLPFDLADHDANDRLAIDPGASGGPIFDCSGKVVALIARVIHQDLRVNPAARSLMHIMQLSGVVIEDGALTASSKWGTANVYGLSAEGLTVTAK